jgi:hypothetical protein
MSRLPAVAATLAAALALLLLLLAAAGLLLVAAFCSDLDVPVSEAAGNDTTCGRRLQQTLWWNHTESAAP